MPKYIDADELIRAVDGNRFVTDSVTSYVRSTVRNIPAADVEPVRHGRYIGTEFDGYADGNPVYYEWKCSECDCVFEDDEPKYRYCPHCGAKMDGEADA